MKSLFNILFTRFNVGDSTIVSELEVGDYYRHNGDTEKYLVVKKYQRNVIVYDSTDRCNRWCYVEDDCIYEGCSTVTDEMIATAEEWAARRALNQ